MDEKTTASSVQLPAAALAELADRCAGLGPRGVAALREVGRHMGAGLLDSIGERPGELSVGRFWDRVDETLRRSNLGSIHFEPIDPDIAAIAWYRLPEAGAEGHATRDVAGCHLATGLLGGALARAAEHPVAVLEVACRGGGAENCWFLVGSRERLLRVHERLSAGATLQAALDH